MKRYKVYQKVIKYELVGETNADSESEALDNIQGSKYGPVRIQDVKNSWGCQKDETGMLVEFGELVARECKW